MLGTCFICSSDLCGSRTFLHCLTQTSQAAHPAGLLPGLAQRWDLCASSWGEIQWTIQEYRALPSSVHRPAPILLHTLCVLFSSSAAARGSQALEGFGLTQQSFSVQNDRAHFSWAEICPSPQPLLHTAPDSSQGLHFWALTAAQGVLWACLLYSRSSWERLKRLLLIFVVIKKVEQESQRGLHLDCSQVFNVWVHYGKNEINEEAGDGAFWFQ